MASAPGREMTAVASSGYGMAAVAMPILAVESGAGSRQLLTTAVAVLAASVIAVVLWSAAGMRWVAWFGVALLAVTAVLYGATPPGVSTAVIALLCGAGAGLATGPRPWVRSGGATTPDGRLGVFAGALLAGIVTLAGARLLLGDTGAALALGVGIAVPAALLRTLWPSANPADPDRSTALRRVLPVAMSGILAVGLVSWTAANDPQLSWFGSVTANGPRDRPTVALTFDDGPNRGTTLAVAELLERHGTRGTFFLVGSAVESDPAIAGELARRGHLVGNHSFHHDHWSWLDPRYPGLVRTQEAIREATGLCPAVFRPPHGQRTPFMSLRVSDAGMRTVTWDVSAQDWSETDPRVIARRVLQRVEPGSIVLLHDGLDGDPAADREVLPEALELILEGLADEGLEAVRLDELIGGPAYTEDC